MEQAHDRHELKLLAAAKGSSPSAGQARKQSPLPLQKKLTHLASKKPGFRITQPVNRDGKLCQTLENVQESPVANTYHASQRKRWIDGVRGEA